MRWKGRRKSQNVRDQRAARYSQGAGMAGGLLRLLPNILRLLGLKGTIIVGVGILGWAFFTGNLGTLSGLSNDINAPADTSVQQSAEEAELVELVSVVLAETEDTWRTLFAEMGQTYQEPTLVLFRGHVRSACGMANSAMGPFYCPGDQKVYIDLNFYDQLKNRFNAPGDFAQAYVIAHEVGHHIQTLLGISNQVHAARQNLAEGNKLSVKLELQADCLAGVWANHANKTRHLLEAGDIEEGLAAASAIGDDTLQKQSRGYVTPDSFTHGTSEQREAWFKKGLQYGDFNLCDTFQ